MRARRRRGIHDCVQSTIPICEWKQGAGQLSACTFHVGDRDGSKSICTKCFFRVMSFLFMVRNVPLMNLKPDAFSSFDLIVPRRLGDDL